MKTRYWKYFAAVLIAVIVLSWFHVDGSELSGIEQVSENHTVSVIKTPASVNNYQSIEYTLTAEQILALKELIQDSHFTRYPFNSYSYKGLHDTYSILLELENGEGKQVDFITIFFVEDLYFSISAPYADEDLTLKIRTKQLDEKLDEILQGLSPSE